jgi:hypothetical protein
VHGSAPDNAQQRVIAHGQEQTLGEALSRSPAQRQTKMMHNPLKTRRAAGERATHRGLKSLGEDPLTAIGKDTTEPADAHGQHNTPSLLGKIGQCSPVSAVDAGRRCPAHRAGSGHAEWSCVDPQFVGLRFNALNGEPTRSNRDSTTHEGDSLPFRRSWSGQIASALSLSPYCMPIQSPGGLLAATHAQGRRWSQSPPDWINVILSEPDERQSQVPNRHAADRLLA